MKKAHAAQFILVAFSSLFVLAGESSAQTLKFGVKYPSPDKEITEVNFPAPANSNFVIFEAVLPARTDADCFASTDFSSAVLVDPDRASTVYDPATGVWYLKNTNAATSIESCRVLLVRSSVDTTDLTMWRARYGSSSNVFEANDKELENNATPAKPQRTASSSFVLTFNGQTTSP